MLLCEARLLSHLPEMFAAAGNKTQAKIRTAAAEAITAICGNMSPNSVQVVLPVLFAEGEVGKPWQGRALSLKMIASFGDYAPEQLGFLLPAVVPQVTLSMSEPKKEISAAAYEAMTNACNVIGNRDIEHMVSNIYNTLQ
jgi:hypothetical protein